MNYFLEILKKERETIISFIKKNGGNVKQTMKNMLNSEEHFDNILDTNEFCTDAEACIILAKDVLYVDSHVNAIRSHTAMVEENRRNQMIAAFG